MTNNRNIALATLMLILLAVLPARSQHITWQDATIIEQGHTTGLDGSQIPTITIEILDPQNSNPYERRQVWVITSQAYLERQHVDVTVGGHLSVWRTGETGNSYGVFWLRYEDKKGKEKKEMHPIVTALGSDYGGQQAATAPVQPTGSAKAELPPPPAGATVVGHTYLGEPLQENFSPELQKQILQVCESYYKSNQATQSPTSRGIGGNMCDRYWSVFVDKKDGYIDLKPETGTDFVWMYVTSGRVSKLSIHWQKGTNFNEQLAFISTKYGPPKIQDTVQAQSSTGTSSQLGRASWELANGDTISELEEVNVRRENAREVTVNFTWKGYVPAKEEKALQANNPY